MSAVPRKPSRTLFISLAILGVVAIGGGLWMTTSAKAVSGGSSEVAATIPSKQSTASSSQAVDVGGLVASGPVIPAELMRHSDRIRSLWVDGPNLAEAMIAFTLNCGSYDCQALYIGNMATGEITETGMGYAEQVNLGVDSESGSHLLLLSWENVSGANCAAAIYGWNGQSLTAESDIHTFEYTDAGCDQMTLSDAKGRWLN